MTVQLGVLRRSCARGLGGPKHAEAFWLGAHAQAQPFIDPKVSCASETIIVGTKWLLRESVLQD